MQLFKLLFIALMIFSVMSCDNSEDILQLKTHYPLDMNQNHQLQVKVVPVGDVDLQFDDMFLEVNADYYNRYGIAIDLQLQQSIPVPEVLIDNPTRIFTPINDTSSIIVYVIDSKFIRVDSAAAYVFMNSGSISVILSQEYQTNRTLAHELGHVFGLGHIQERNNVMTLNQIAWQYDVPNNFNSTQIDEILQSFEQPKWAASKFNLQKSMIITCSSTYILE